jgi:pyruvate dehydrogenase complex dihydrolipoamide acetyltransferase long form
MSDVEAQELNMAKQIIMPKLGAEVAEGEIVEWAKNESDWVVKEEVVVVVETDKITTEIESPDSGYLHIIKQVGEKVKISETIGLLCETEEEMQQEIKKGGSPAAPPPEPAAGAEDDRKVSPAGPLAAEPSDAAGSSRQRQEIRISPLARKLAAEHGLDIYELRGSGPGGRIKKRDIMEALENRKQAPAAARPAASAPAESPQAAAGALKTVKEAVPLRGRRRVIAERLHASLQQMAQFTDMGEMDVSELVAFRQRLLNYEERIKVRIGYNAIIMKAAALALREMPALNASIVGEEIHIWNEINIGMAVDTEDGLIVPVVPNADRKPIAQIQHELDDLSARAREGKLLPDEISGGTMTISNFGSYGSYFGTPIINPPEAILFGVGVIRQVPVIIDDDITGRWIMTYSLTMDHRLVDGAKGGRYINRIREILGAPDLLGILW